MRNILLYTLIVFVMLATYSRSSHAQEKAEKPAKAFLAFLIKLDAAQLELQSGKAEAFKSIWSHGDDITLSGGFGGTVEKGWTAISKRLDWVGEQFSKGTNKIERIVTTQSGSLGYVVQLEHISFTVPGTGKPATRDYRVTMIFRREKNGWKIVHRQADSQMVKQAPE